jgi:O-methyltransferase involved in polyketide biosynthesis
LINVGHQNSEPTTWLVEGLRIYLSPDEAVALPAATKRPAATAQVR